MHHRDVNKTQWKSRLCAEVRKLLLSFCSYSVSVCEDVDFEKKIYEATLTSTNFALASSEKDITTPCVNMKISVIPIEQFSFRQSGLTSRHALILFFDLTRLALPSFQKQKKRS